MSKLEEIRDFCYKDWDCGDNSCQFATNRTGMRPNGGCRCLPRGQHEIKNFVESIKSAMKGMLTVIDAVKKHGYLIHDKLPGTEAREINDALDELEASK